MNKQPRICSGEWDAQAPLGFWDTNGLPNLGQTTGLHNNQQKKRTCRLVNFVAPADHRVKLKESKKEDNYQDLAWELKKPWNIKVTMIPIIIDALDNITKGFVQGLDVI